MRTAVFSAIIAICALCLTHDASAQGTLQFNQVLAFEVPSSTSVPFTVPAGKVWKLEGAGGGSTSCRFMLRDASSVNLGYLYYSTTTTAMVTYPLWLPSSYSGILYCYNCAGSAAILSVIEFNVIP